MIYALSECHSGLIPWMDVFKKVQEFWQLTGAHFGSNYFGTNETATS
jgi:hypothetical protein